MPTVTGRHRIRSQASPSARCRFSGAAVRQRTQPPRHRRGHHARRSRPRDPSPAPGVRPERARTRRTRSPGVRSCPVPDRAMLPVRHPSLAPGTKRAHSRRHERGLARPRSGSPTGSREVRADAGGRRRPDRGAERSRMGCRARPLLRPGRGARRVPDLRGVRPGRRRPAGSFTRTARVRYPAGPPPRGSTRCRLGVPAPRPAPSRRRSCASPSTGGRAARRAV